jgi:type IV secretion/conjugal transfer VirB4 family ATPase
MFNKSQRSQQGFSDLLNYAHFIDDGVIINKDGAFLMVYRFRGPDLYSASSAQLNALTATINRMASFLEDGWMLHVDEVRIPSLDYPDASIFPSTVAELIDEERRESYETAGNHYENMQFISFIWKFPLSVVKTTRHWFIEGLPDETHQDLSQLLKQFYATVDRCIGLLITQFILEKLNSQDLLSYLKCCITGDIAPAAVPQDGCFLDVVLACRNVIAGYLPRVGDKAIYLLSIIGYLNEETIPGLLEELGTYPLIYRWSNRFVPLSEVTAEREIKRYVRNWNNKVKGFSGILKEAVFGKPSNKINQDALQMSGQATEALTHNSSSNTRFGYWTSTLVLMHEDTSLLDKAGRDLSAYLEQSGFSCIQEDIHAFDAWLGTIPGHGSCNLRRFFINSINLAHVLPLHTLWTGAAFSSSESLLPAHSPPVFYADTTGKTPFRFHMDVGDVGHQVVLGPTGSGKSTYLGFLIAQFLRYPGAQIFVFDKDYSQQGLTAALGGQHYDIGRNEDLSFCPLADLSTETKQARATQFIEDLVFLQNVNLTPQIRAAIHTAIVALAEDTNSHRTLTVFRSEVQNEEVRSALSYYTIDGQLKLLDAAHDATPCSDSYLQTFEMGWVLAQKEEIYVPILRTIFNRIEVSLEAAKKQAPTLIILEEAWLYISHELFSRQLKDWLKTCRKKNARVVFATQSLADLYDPTYKSLTETTAAIMESCPSKIYLPNPSIEAEIKTLYQKMGLSDRQLEIITQAIPKQQYYLISPEGNRLIDLRLHDIALSFVGLSREKTKDLLQCQYHNPDHWLADWLQQQGISSVVNQ